MADIAGLSKVIKQQVVAICRNDNIYREEEMANMIDMLCDAHVMALSALVGACLITAKGRRLRQEPYEDLMATVRDLVEKSDTDFSLRLRAKTLGFIEEHHTPNPFDGKKAT